MNLKEKALFEISCEAQIMVSEAVDKIMNDLVDNGVTLEQLTSQILCDILGLYYKRERNPRSAELYMAKDLEDFIKSSLANEIDVIFGETVN